MTASHIASILGGLPVVAFIEFGKDADTPNGAGEYWAEVVDICWVRRDGTAGKTIPQSVRDRAEVYDPYFCDLTESVSEQLAYERSLEDHEPGEMFTFDVRSEATTTDLNAVPGMNK